MIELVNTIIGLLILALAVGFALGICAMAWWQERRDAERWENEMRTQLFVGGTDRETRRRRWLARHAERRF
jgi:hypothetical protein